MPWLEILAMRQEKRKKNPVMPSLQSLPDGNSLGALVQVRGKRGKSAKERRLAKGQQYYAGEHRV
jgi:hypothetical protein